MEIKWSAVEAIFNAIRAKFDGKGGSKMNLTFTDVFGHQYTETVLKPIDFTERRIHITHRPNQTCDKIASLYVTILRQCFERFGINPERLWPSAENDTLTIKAKAKF
jgi:hypothetical protein